jgi:K+-sensing histidine kinase KdpD
MGLAICMSIIEAHCGNICAENRPEGGVRIRIELPAAENSMSQVQNAGGET